MDTNDVVKAAQIADFDAARAAIEQAEQPQEQEQEQEQDEKPDDDVKEDEQEVIEDIAEKAVENLDVAANAAVEKENELQQIRAELDKLAAENQQLKETLAQQSELQMGELVKPELDLASLVYDDEETVAAKKAQYEQELKKYWEEVEKRKAEEKANTIGALAKIPELAGFDEMLPQIEGIIANNKLLNSDDVPLEEKYITAYAIARGVNAINNPPQQQEQAQPEQQITPDKFVELYNSNPEFQQAIANQKKEALKDGQQVPPLSATDGAGNAALNIPEKAKTFEDARSLMSRILQNG
jgi:hypothetical protein